MSCPDLGAFWTENKERIAKALPRGVDELAKIFRAGADACGLHQVVEGRCIHWRTVDTQPVVIFAFVPDARDLDGVADVYVQARECLPALTVVFVHQWTDGEGNWDVFAIGPRRAMRHCDRIYGTKTVQERGPQLREDLYHLFACDRDFPEPGQAEWAELLAGPADGITGQLGALVARHDCTQIVGNGSVQWLAAQGRLEAQFFILPDPEQIGAFMDIYEQIRETDCPISFVLVKGDEPRSYDIFRLSARSYLEHQNQVKGRLRLEVRGEGKMLEGLRWAPRWTSHVGCIKGCLDYLGCEVSDAWLFGATGHAFVVNISPGLCPSGPTDWDTAGFLRLGRNVGYQIESVDRYCPEKSDRREAQERAWDHVRRSIDDGLPCYGWELDIPEYYVIFGYDKTGYYISGPGCDEGAGPIPWQNLGTSEIGVVFVASVRRTEPADTRQSVRQAFSYALDLGHNRRKWTDRVGGLQGYDLWIETLAQGHADRFGLGYNAAVWAECRRFAVEFLREVRQRFDDGLHALFDAATAQYEIVAQNLKAVSAACPFRECGSQHVKVDSRALDAVEALKRARDAEASGLDILADLIGALEC
ncbi:MAG: hypothetical protein JW993_05825 [Sedimentisphaerales bacterium]|nr:hypothetical protein [Sedimentisphaerales bacterium]